MRKSMKSLLAVLVLATPLALTSCEGMFDDIFGEWSRPTAAETAPTAASISFATSARVLGTQDGKLTNVLTNTGDGKVTYASGDESVATVDPATGEVTPLSAGTTTITATVADSQGYTYATKTAQYELTVGTGFHIRKWDDTAKALTDDFTTGDILEGTVTAAQLAAAGTHIIRGNVTLSDAVTLAGDVELVLGDNASLTINNQIVGGTINPSSYLPNYQHSLTIYAQSDDASTRGKLTVQCPDEMGIKYVYALTIHSGEVVVSSGLNAGGTGDYGINCNTMVVNGGEIWAQSADAPTQSARTAIYTQTSLKINDGVVKAICGSCSYTGSNADGICSGGTIEINGGSVEAKGSDMSGTGNSAGCGIYASTSLTINGNAVVKATGGNYSGPSTIVDRGGPGIMSSTTINGGTVTAIGGNSTNSAGGYGCNGYLYIHGGQSMVLGGHGGTGHTSIEACYASVYYYGGTIIAIGDETGRAVRNNLYNKSGAAITVYTNTDGSTTDFPVSASIANTGGTSITVRGMKIG